MEGMSAWELTLMRNEIYAVHGRPFKDPDLRSYFSSRPWYHADPQFKEKSLAPLELENARFILDYQRRQGKM